jgi:positive regulator of sigma E activity
MIRILRYTEYLYLIVAFFAGYRLIELLGTDSQERLIFGFFFVVSVGMFFFRRNYRKKFEKRERESDC